MREAHSRRAVLAALGAGTALAVTPQGHAQQANESPAPPPNAFRGAHQPRSLPFDPTRLRGLSERLVVSHWENNYQGSVRALNEIEQRLDAMRRDPDLPAYVYGDLKREELARTGSVILHEHYFDNLGGDGRPAGSALALIEASFGSWDTWRDEFVRTARALSGGSGWVVLALNLQTGDVHNYWAWDHMHNAVFGLPLLVLDMYEHSYHMDFGSAAARYIDAFLDNVDWQEVDRRAAWAAQVDRTRRARPAG